MICKHAIALSSILAVTACAGQVSRSVVEVPVKVRNAPVIDSSEYSEPTPVSGNVSNQSTATQAVILALMDDADAYTQKGNTEQAASVIERALRIEPGNAWLWQRLAKIRLQRQQWQQAIGLARKSNALAANNKQLMADNWGIIAIAYEKLGDKVKAREARNKQTAEG